MEVSQGKTHYKRKEVWKLNNNKEVVYLPLEEIKPNPYQPRRTFSQKSLKELSESIKNYGVLQPISVRQLRDKSYELIAGERRLRASSLAGLSKIPALVYSYKEKDTAVLALMENIQREDLNYIEEALGYENLIRDHGLSQREIGEAIGKSQSTIANKLRLLRLPKKIQESLIEEGLSERHGRALLKLPDEELMTRVLNRVVSNKLNVKQTEALVKGILEDILKEEEPKKEQKVRAMIDTRIYLNTMKQAYQAIKETAQGAEYRERDKGDYVEVVVRIPKR